MGTIWALVALALCVVTVLPLWSNPHWLVRGWEFPRLQLAVLIAATIAVGLLWEPVGPALRASTLALLVAALVFQIWWIVPFSRLFPVECASSGHHDREARISLLAANVLMTNAEHGRLLELVARHEPDIVITLESDANWERSLDSLLVTMPYSSKCPMDNLYGMHVYSRLPLEDVELSFLIEYDIPSMTMRVTLRSGQALQLHVVHPAPPSPTENELSSQRDAELILVGRAAASAALPVIVAGDLNDVAWSRTTRLFRKISGLLDPRVGRGMFNTFHVDMPLLRYPLDHVFLSPDFRLVSLCRLDSIGSDHFPIFIELQLTSSGGPPDDEAGLQADSEDREEAREIVQEGREAERSRD